LVKSDNVLFVDCEKGLLAKAPVFVETQNSGFGDGNKLLLGIQQV
jgi:hypothetical protein